MFLYCFGSFATTAVSTMVCADFSSFTFFLVGAGGLNPRSPLTSFGASVVPASSRS